MVRLHYESRVLIAALPVLAAQSTWQHPLLAGDPALRTDMLALADRMPLILGVLDQLPQVVGHGDASPQNLLIPVEKPDTFVVVDWALGGAAAAGDDLGQLLGQIGLSKQTCGRSVCTHPTFKEMPMRKISYAIAGAVVVAAAGLTVAAPAHSAPPEPGDRAAVATKDRVPPARPLPPRKPIKPTPPPREICISRPVGEGMVGPAVCWIYFEIPGPDIRW